MQLNGTQQSQAAFIQWLRTRHPQLYAMALNDPGTLAGFSDVWNKITTGVSNIIGKASEVLPAYLQTKQQIELLKLNIARAKAGMMPVDALPASAGGAVATQPAATGGGFMDSLPPWAIPAAIGVALLLFMRR
ncbi:MAG: hypothetical protein AB7P97_20340 [Hyphomonadaceae bacterium]